MAAEEKKTSEVEKLVYHGNRLPIWVIVPWVILVIFVVVYCARYVWPDLQSWLTR